MERAAILVARDAWQASVPATFTAAAGAELADRPMALVREAVRPAGGVAPVSVEPRLDAAMRALLKMRDGFDALARHGVTKLNPDKLGPLRAQLLARGLAVYQALAGVADQQLVNKLPSLSTVGDLVFLGLVALALYEASRARRFVFG